MTGRRDKRWESELILIPKIRWPTGESLPFPFWGGGWQGQSHQGQACKDEEGRSSTHWLQFPTLEREKPGLHRLSEGDGKDHPSKTDIVPHLLNNPLFSSAAIFNSYTYTAMCTHPPATQTQINSSEESWEATGGLPVVLLYHFKQI